MKRLQIVPSPVRFGSALLLMLVIAGCTPGGQFDPTALFDSDTFSQKKKLQGQRELVFPNGVPGVENGVPPELVKGYQPPPEQAVNDTATPNATAQAAAEPKPKQKTEQKPKPKVASAPAQPRDKAFDEKPPTRISVGLGPKPSAPAQPVTQQPTPSQSVWPAPQTAPAPQGSNQTVWPAPPPTGPTQQAAQPSQSVWPNPPAPGTSPQ